jgi:hypothetical protein
MAEGMVVVSVFDVAVVWREGGGGGCSRGVRNREVGVSGVSKVARGWGAAFGGRDDRLSVPWSRARRWWVLGRGRQAVDILCSGRLLEGVRLELLSGRGLGWDDMVWLS